MIRLAILYGDACATTIDMAPLRWWRVRRRPRALRPIAGRPFRQKCMGTPNPIAILAARGPDVGAAKVVRGCASHWAKTSGDPQSPWWFLPVRRPRPRSHRARFPMPGGCYHHHSAPRVCGQPPRRSLAPRLLVSHPPAHTPRFKPVASFAITRPPAAAATRPLKLRRGSPPGVRLASCSPARPQPERNARPPPPDSSDRTPVLSPVKEVASLSGRCDALVWQPFWGASRRPPDPLRPGATPGPPSIPFCDLYADHRRFCGINNHTPLTPRSLRPIIALYSHCFLERTQKWR